jgi:hypothetical protein
MPTVLTVDGYKFFFFMRENGEPPHIHVYKAECACKFWLKPIALARNRNFKSHELTKIRKIIEEYHDYLLEKYNEYHG